MWQVNKTWTLIVTDTVFIRCLAIVNVKPKTLNWFPKLPRTWNHSIGVWDMYFTFWGFSGDQLLRHIPSYADLPLKRNLVESCLLSPPQSSSGNAFKTVCVRRDRKACWLQNPGLSLPKYSMDTTGVSKGKLRWRFAGIWSLPFGSAHLSLSSRGYWTLWMEPEGLHSAGVEAPYQTCW